MSKRTLQDFDQVYVDEEALERSMTPDNEVKILSKGKFEMETKKVVRHTADFLPEER